MIPAGTRRLQDKDPIGTQLRMLAVFSLPDAQPALLLREQRRALVRQVAEISASSGKAIELSVLQYDVNRDRLRRVLEDSAGWDIVHFSGHGLVDGLLLEDLVAQPDIVPADELIDLLRPNRSRLKLLVLSSCNSGAAPPPDSVVSRFADASAGPQLTVPVLAVEAVRRLDCAVLAMRYTVDDDFSVAIAHQLYARILGSSQPLTRALQIALPDALGDRPRPGLPPLSPERGPLR